MKPIELPVFFLTDEQHALEKAGIEVEEDDFDTFDQRPLTFYQISAVEPYKNKGEYKFCKVYSNGDYWICNIKYNDLKRKLERE